MKWNEKNKHKNVLSKLTTHVPFHHKKNKFLPEPDNKVNGKAHIIIIIFSVFVLFFFFSRFISIVSVNTINADAHTPKKWKKKKMGSAAATDPNHDIAGKKYIVNLLLFYKFWWDHALEKIKANETP